MAGVILRRGRSVGGRGAERGSLNWPGAKPPLEDISYFSHESIREAVM